MASQALTLCSIPRAIAGHTGIIQANAVRSWKRLPGVEVVLFGQEEGISELAAATGARHEPELARNEHGTPMLSDAYARIKRLATTRVVAYVNTDIMFTSNLLSAVAILANSPWESWLIVGQRHDVDIVKPVDLDAVGEDAFLRDTAATGTLHGKAGIDFIIFPKTLPIAWPPMAVGRPGWDSWLIYAVRAAGIPVVDVTGVVTAVHQNHPSGYNPDGAEARANRSSGGGYYRMGTIRDANWRLVREPAGLALRRRLAGDFWFSPPVRAALALRRHLTSRHG